MDKVDARCVVLADRHHALGEGICGLLESSFDAIARSFDDRHEKREAAVADHQGLGIT